MYQLHTEEERRVHQLQTILTQNNFSIVAARNKAHRLLNSQGLEAVKQEIYNYHPELKEIDEIALSLCK